MNEYELMNIADLVVCSKCGGKHFRLYKHFEGDKDNGIMVLFTVCVSCNEVTQKCEHVLIKHEG